MSKCLLAQGIIFLPRLASHWLLLLKNCYICELFGFCRAYDYQPHSQAHFQQGRGALIYLR